MQKRPSSREIIAALVAQVLESRYPSQPFEETNKQDWLRTAMESDPIVLLEAAWEWWRDHPEGKFRPGPGQLREVAAGWPVSDQPYVQLRDALDAEETAGLTALIERYGRQAWGEIDRLRVLPSQEQRWGKVNTEHRRYVFAKERMKERGGQPWNPAELGPIQIANGHMLALVSPTVRDDGRHAQFTERLEGLATQKRLG